MTEPRFRPYGPPASGMRVDIMQAPDGVTVSGACVHAMMVAMTAPGVTPDDIMAALGRMAHKGCPPVEFAYQWSPARLVGSPAVPLAPGAREGILGYLADNPPESCGCDPDVSLVITPPGTGATVRLEHEDGCPGVGRASKGWGVQIHRPVND